MVEITLPIILQIIQTVSISVGIFYYLFIMRNIQRSQQEAEKARQRDNLFMRFQSFDRTFAEAEEDFRSQEWGTTMEDYQNHSLKSKASFNYLQDRYNAIGLMLKEKMMDPDLLYQTFTPLQTINFWESIELIVKDYREKTNDTMYHEALEYMYNDAMKRFPNLITRRSRAKK
jgi:hypothetical protein